VCNSLYGLQFADDLFGLFIYTLQFVPVLLGWIDCSGDQYGSYEVDYSILGYDLTFKFNSLCNVADDCCLLLYIK
jgi:hypothetical protein